jgi:hypothetical protein
MYPPERACPSDKNVVRPHAQKHNLDGREHGETEAHEHAFNLSHIRPLSVTEGIAADRYK